MFQKCQVRGILPFGDFPIWAFAAPYKAITLRYTLRRNETVHIHTSILCLKQHSDTLWKTPQTPSSHLQTLTDTSKRHSMSTRNTAHPWTAFLGVWGSLLVSFGVCWSLMVSVVVLISSEIPGGGVWEHIDEEYVCLWGLDASKGVYECSGHVWCRKCPIMERLRKAKFHAPDTFEISKYQKPPYIIGRVKNGTGPSKIKKTFQDGWIPM